MRRYIFVTGSVISSLGKGIASSSLAALLQSHGYKTRLKKLDPYLNLDPGTMSPNQHGEVYVTADGTETDLDIGHYERFANIEAQKSDSFTSGRIYADVLARERRGEYLGATVQVIPHITDYIKEIIPLHVDPDVDFLIIEVGGTVGDIESQPFLEAIRQFCHTSVETIQIHLTYIPYLASTKELKTKPSQHAIKGLLQAGLQPDILLCRCEHELSDVEKTKLSLFCNVKKENVILARDVETIYSIPLHFAASKLDMQIFNLFHMRPKQTADLSLWHHFVKRLEHPKHTVPIAIVGKFCF